jgi:hypothetical protein
MKQKKFSRKLVLNKTTIAMLNPSEQGNVNGGIRTVLTVGCNYTDDCGYTDDCAYTISCMCTQPGCQDSAYGQNGCIYTNYGDMMGCPATMTLCGELYCP